MAEETQVVVNEAMDTMVIPSNLLANVWEENPTTSAQPKAEPTPAVPDTTPAPAANAEPAPATEQTPAATPQGDADVFDADQYLKEQTGWENWDSAKAAKAKLEEYEKAPKTEFKFQNEDSEKYFNAIKEGKEDDIYSYLNTKKQLERAEKLDVSDIRNAEAVLKLDLQFKYKELTPEQVDRKFSKQFPMPAKPRQSELQTDEDYASTVKDWEAQVKDIQQDIILEATIAKPSLSKFKTDLVLPDIPQTQPQPQGPSQEELAAKAKVRSEYLASIPSGLNNFKGYSVTVKDEGVEIPITYSISDEERSAMKGDMEAFNDVEYFGKRWFDPAIGNVNPTKMADDKYKLDNFDKILQKVASEAASKRLEAYLKAKGNINVSGVQPQAQNGNMTTTKTEMQKNVDYIWENG